MLITFILLYLCLNLAIGYWGSRRVNNTSDFALAGRNLSIWVASTSIFATWFGSETVVSSSVLFAEGGFMAVVKDPFGAALCLFLTGLLIARPMYRMNVTTISDFYRIRYGKGVEFFSALFISISYLGWIAAQLQAMGILMSVITVGTFWEMSVLQGSLIGGVLVTVYTVMGGMWSVSLTDFIQTIVIIIGLLLLTGSLMLAVDDWSLLMDSQPTGFFDVLPEPTSDAWLVYVAAWITVGVGSLPSQDVIQRVLSAKNEKIAVRATYLAAGMYLFFSFFPLLIGLCGKYLYPDLMMGDNQEAMLPRIVLLHSSIFVQILFFGALLSAIMSTTSGAILAPATLMSENLLRPLFKNMTDRAMLRTMRTSVVIITILAVYMANTGGTIYELAAETSSFTLVSVVASFVLGLYWKRATNTAAIASMISGLVLWKGTEWSGYSEASSLLIGVITSFVVMILISLLTRQEEEEIA